MCTHYEYDGAFIVVVNNGRVFNPDHIISNRLNPSSTVGGAVCSLALTYGSKTRNNIPTSY